MHLRISKFNLGLTAMILFLILLDNHLFYLIPYPGNFLTGYGVTLVTGGICIVSTLYFILRSAGELPKYIGLWTFGVAVSVVFVILMSGLLYPIQGWMYTIKFGAHFFQLLLVIPLMALFHKDGNPDKLFDKINVLIFLWYCILILQSVVYKNIGQLIFDFNSYFSDNDVSIRSEGIRISLNSFGNFMILYNLYRIFNSKRLSKKKFNLLQLLLGLYCLFFVQQTRAYIIIIFIVSIIMLYCKSERKNERILCSILIAVLLMALASSTYFSDLLSSFDTTGEYKGSTILRIYAIQYYWGYFISNPLYGMGLPSHVYYYSIVRGPAGYAVWNDVGILGLLAQTGLFTIILYIIPLIRINIICRVCFNVIDKTKAAFLIGTLAYLILTTFTLIITDSGRILLFPIIIAYCEFVFKELNTDTEIEYKEEK